MQLRIGSRGSTLALVQSEWVRDRLQALHPGLSVEIEVIQTKGDKLLDAPLAKIGDKGLFTKELESGDARRARRPRRALGQGHAHGDRRTGSTIAAFTKREDVRDVFVGGTTRRTERRRRDRPRPADAAPRSALSSLRRRSQLLAARPDLELVDIRGNVETRLRKVDEQGMAGTVLAAAGLRPSRAAGCAAFAFSFDEMLPAVGQGALAIEGAGRRRARARARRPAAARRRAPSPCAPSAP